MKKNASTIKDIARELGISPSTVSRALKDHFEISEKTKKEVRRVADELSYQPNTLALSLRNSKSNTIGLIIPEIVHFFFSTVISGIEDVAHSRGYNLIITQSNESLDKEKANAQILFNNRVDGVLISLSEETEDIDHLKVLNDKGLSFVFFDRISEDMDSSSVIVDDFLGGYQATKHLIDMGYKKIAHLAGPSNLDISTQRMNGYKKALEEGGIAYSENLVLLNSISSENETFNSIYELLKNYSPDAIFAFHDLAAMSAIKAAQNYGKNVPIDFGVIGYSNWQFTSLTNPSISTVEQPGFEMGQQAAELLINQIESDRKPDYEKIKLNTKLLIRESTKKI
ncbi:MAG: LacI family DNA-binding transcriptional regulator [Ekhidna sp.]